MELGRIDITTETSMMASCMAMPWVGHLDRLFHIFVFLKNKHNSEMVFDPSPIDIDKANFEPQDWKQSIQYTENIKRI